MSMIDTEISLGPAARPARPDGPAARPARPDGHAAQGWWLLPAIALGALCWIGLIAALI